MHNIQPVITQIRNTAAAPSRSVVFYFCLFFFLPTRAQYGRSPRNKFVVLLYTRDVTFPLFLMADDYRKRNKRKERKIEQ